MALGLARQRRPRPSPPRGTERTSCPAAASAARPVHEQRLANLATRRDEHGQCPPAFQKEIRPPKFGRGTYGSRCRRSSSQMSSLSSARAGRFCGPLRASKSDYVRQLFPVRQSVVALDALEVRDRRSPRTCSAGSPRNPSPGARARAPPRSRETDAPRRESPCSASRRRRPSWRTRLRRGEDSASPTSNRHSASRVASQRPGARRAMGVQQKLHRPVDAQVLQKVLGVDSAPASRYGSSTLASSTTSTVGSFCRSMFTQPSIRSRPQPTCRSAPSRNRFTRLPA